MPALAAPRPLPRQPVRRHAAQAQLIQDRETGWQLIQLSVPGPARAADPQAGLRAKIALQAGGNLFSLTIDGHELLHQPDTLGELTEQRAGTPIMFPTPNRVRDGRMRFEGREFRFPPNNGPNFIHGLARRHPFAVGKLGVLRGAARAETYLEWDKRHPEFALFPIRHRLSVGFSLGKTGLRIDYRVHNRDRVRLPFGFGLHPYFRIPGDREGVSLKVPLARRMEAETMLPTGRLLSVGGTAHDLRKLTGLPGLALDDVYLGMQPHKAARFELRDPGVEVRLLGSAAFTHLVVFTPPDRPFFCIENQTSSTDAHNLWDRGKKTGLAPAGGPPRQDRRRLRRLEDPPLIAAPT